jgi:hypothetical protein
VQGIGQYTCISSDGAGRAKLWVDNNATRTMSLLTLNRTVLKQGIPNGLSKARNTEELVE